MCSRRYNISISKFGISTGARYKINTANNDHYYFGNRFSANSLAWYSFGNKTTISPNAGFLYEHSNTSKLAGAKIDQTGGYLFGAVAGAEVNLKKITVGFNAQLPLAQNFANGQTATTVKGMLHVSFVL